MATQIVIHNGSSILLDDSYRISWADKGKDWVDGWVPNTIHAVIYNNLAGPTDMLTLYEGKYRQELQKFAAMQIGMARS